MAKKTHLEDQLDYEQQMKQNEFAFKQMLKSVRPELYVLFDLLEETKINPIILFKVMRHLNNLATGSKYGQVTIFIENGVATFVRGEEADKLNEKVLLDN